MASRLFSLPFEEADVRRLGGDAAFARADAWQREGHVQQPVASMGALNAEVKGTWQRLDVAQVTAAGDKLTSQCSCEQGTLCVHAATLLLHWLRRPEAFLQGNLPAAPQRPALDMVDLGGEEDDEAAETAVKSPANDLASLLDLFSMTELRDVARRRNVRPTARTKVDLVRQLAEALSPAGSVDAALAQLSRDELLVLQIIDLLGPDLTTSADVSAAFRALGGSAPIVPVAGLLDLALIGVVEYPGMPATTFAVPMAVTQRLGSFTAPTRPVVSATGESTAAKGLDLLQALHVLVHEAQSRPLPPRSPAPRSAADPRIVPPFWSIVSPPGVEPAAATYRSYQHARLTPITPMLVPDEREDLARQMGRSPAFVTLALHVALTLEIIDTTDRLTAAPARLQALCELSPAVRQQVYMATLTAPQYLGELRRLVGEDSALEMHCRLGYFGQTSPLLDQAAQLRHLLLRTVSKLPPNVWFDYAGFRELLRIWAPFQAAPLSFSQVGGGTHPLWWISDHAQPEQPLDLTTPSGWQQLYGQFVDEVFSGVMVWIGLIELEIGPDGPRAFRVRSVEGEGDLGAGPIQLADDLTIQIPAGLSDARVYTILALGGELTQVAPEGLRYRLTPERVRILFDTGVGGPLLMQSLKDWTGQALPRSMRTAINRWWASYGRVRLYDDLTLIELADDYLLPELLRSTSLAAVIIHTFSPRLIAVEAQAVESIITELSRAGHPPSIAEGR